MSSLKDIAIQKQHEKASADTFILNKYPNYQFVKHGDPNINEPDCIYVNDSSVIGIEITTGEYTDIIMRDRRKDANPEQPVQQRRYKIIEPDISIQKRLGNALKNHLTKSYTGVSNLILVIKSFGVLEDDNSLNNHKNYLKIITKNSPKNPFNSIYLLHDGTSHTSSLPIIIKIFPSI